MLDRGGVAPLILEYGTDGVSVQFHASGALPSERTPGTHRLVAGWNGAG